MCEICFDGFYTFSNKERIQLAKDLNVDDVVSSAINQLFDAGVIDAKTKKQLFVSHNAPLQKAVVEGFGKTLAKIEYGTPNYDFLKQLQTNTAVFAMFKNHASMQDMAALLKDKDGNLRSKYDFKKEALKIDGTYRGSKLDVEYDTAVRQARMASQWAKYQKNKHLYPNLKYLLTKAAKPDEKHLQYVGIIRPVDDDFWNAHYPPNRWRCQCSVEQTDDDATDIPGSLPPVPDEFAFNSGKEGQVFDLKNSDYIKSLPPISQPALIKKAIAVQQVEAGAKLPYHTLYQSKSGGRVEAHPFTYQENDFNEVVKTVRSLANDGKNMRLLPSMADGKLRKALLPEGVAKKTRTPDAVDIDDGKLYDVKKIKGISKNTIGHSLNSVRGQADNIILDVPEKWPFTKYETFKMITTKMKLKEMNGFGNVWVNYKGKWHYNPHKKQKD